MTINPLHLNGMMQRSQDVSTIKHNAEQRTIVQQENIQVSFERRTENIVKTVVESQHKENPEGHFDAKEEGKNKYFSNRKKNEKSELKDQVIEKRKSFGFDVTV